MLERPALNDATLVAALRDGFGLPVERLEFAPLGNDSAAWTYRAATADGGRWFVKVRREPRRAGILVPRYLRDTGFDEVVAARPTRDGEPWLWLGPWSVLAFPLVDAPSALRAGLDEDGWRRLGAFAARLHATVLPPGLAALTPREDFRPRATDVARRVALHLDDLPDTATASPDDPGARLVAAWREHAPVIARLVRRSEELADRIRARAATGMATRFVPCHADLHVGNVLVGPDGRLSVIDWDEVILAPPERDLMFVRGSAIAGVVSDQQATAFETGYGTVEADPLLIAWYRIDWVIQDLADFARRALLDPDAGEATRRNALRLFEANFAPGDGVATAVAADDALGADGRG